MYIYMICSYIIWRYIYAYIYTYTYIYMYIYIHTHIYAWVHVYTHIYILIILWVFFCFFRGGGGGGSCAKRDSDQHPCEQNHQKKIFKPHVGGGGFSIAKRVARTSDVTLFIFSRILWGSRFRTMQNLSTKRRLIWTIYATLLMTLTTNFCLSIRVSMFGYVRLVSGPSS